MLIRIWSRKTFTRPFGTLRKPAQSQNFVIVSADTDFGTLLAQQRWSKPSVVLFRRGADRRPELQVDLLLHNLPNLKDDLDTGSVVVIEEDRIRVRRLPIFGRE